MFDTRTSSIRGRHGLGLLEALAALGLLAASCGPVINMITMGGRLNNFAAHRLVLELRARRHLAEMATTSYHVLVADRSFPVVLEEPRDAEGYTPWVTDITEEAEVRPLENGLAEAIIRLKYKETGKRGANREIEVRRLIASPTVSLESRYSLGGES